MTCPHCGFENTEERESCFRCGQVLDLSGVDILPPRLRRGAPSNRVAEGVARWWNQGFSWRRNLSRFSPLAAFLTSLVPGLGHALQGEQRRGGCLFLVWVGCALLVLVRDMPNSWRPMFVPEWLLQPRLLPLTVHAWIMADAYSRRVGFTGRRPSLAETAVVTVAAVLLLVSPWALGVLPGQGRFQAVYAGVDVQEAGISRGDRLLVDRQGLVAEEIPAGSVVLYLAPWSVAQGQMMGRVLAGPGCRAEWRQRSATLLLDGRPTALGGFEKLSDADLRLAEGELLVLPAWRTGLKSWQDLVVPAESIRGVAVEVVEPRSHRRDLTR